MSLASLFSLAVPSSLRAIDFALFARNFQYLSPKPKMINKCNNYYDSNGAFFNVHSKILSSLLRSHPVDRRNVTRRDEMIKQKNKKLVRNAIRQLMITFNLIEYTIALTRRYEFMIIFFVFSFQRNSIETLHLFTCNCVFCYH